MNPRKHSNSLLVGVGQFLTASTFPSSIWMPCLLMLFPRNCIEDRLKEHFKLSGTDRNLSSISGPPQSAGNVLHAPGVDEDIVYVDEHKPVEEIQEHLMHEVMEYRHEVQGCVAQATDALGLYQWWNAPETGDGSVWCGAGQCEVAQVLPGTDWTL